MNKFENYCTKFVQSIGSKEGAVSPSIVSSASFSYGSPETAEGIFNGSVKKPLYSRMGNPTTAKLESIMAEMDEGIGAVATSSGMGATTLAVMSLLSQGDEIISIGGLFGGTYALFDETLSRFGITTHFFDVEAFDAIEKAINDNTKIIFLESVGNPNMRLPDIKRIASIADKYDVALIVDNTITPLSVSPLALGADITVYSTTKIISGNSSALGGCVVFRAISENADKFKTQRYPFLQKFIKNAGKTALIPNAKKRALRDLGMSANAHASYQTLLGLETLALRLPRIVKSVETVALELAKYGIAVNHPCIQSHPHHARYKEDFQYGCGTLLTIDMQSKERAYDFLRKTKIATITANIGDSRTLALHMASTIYSDFDEKTREFLGITDGLIRISIGLENPVEIINDFIQATK
ncbi:O-acetylhomoserine aminocarboxypropyltransferase/cysteine synthase [Sulfurimonas sediminis]|uniref:O-acetylhomoserine aminocarboxypropyltransferase/cysteine synthase n=1 Tax=Sulfurimonas sediminis TaxID=2590020 RepID=A0A7M1B3C9_9BACT|nr:aminotransferase class I/II-fold pyridoxal phosphate-dependent enzyme [Sulfurimonas sediminis]QOP44257.1 O-acetylhomoserine aminocarboxypropyltransferase/cysteine synthase [Sulfurimonas sediminis]